VLFSSKQLVAIFGYRSNMNRITASFIIPLLCFQSCLDEVHQCIYTEAFTKNVLTQGEWNVDSIRFIVRDTLSGFATDTVFLNDGTFKFEAIETDSCTGHGNVLYQRRSGVLVHMRYDIVAPYFPKGSFVRFSCDSFLDGYPKPYNHAGQSTYPNNNFRTYDNYYSKYFNTYQPGLYRNWKFYLTKK
jgi:hypothetical protein